MMLVMFVLGIACGMILGMGVTVIFYDDERLGEILKGKDNGSD